LDAGVTWKIPANEPCQRVYNVLRQALPRDSGFLP